MEPSSLPWIFKDGAERNAIACFFLEFSFKSYNVCAVKLSYDYCTLQLCQTTVPHSEASFQVGRTNWMPEASKTSEPVLGGTILSAKQFLKKNGKKMFAWVEDRFTNWEWLQIVVDGQIRFEYATCGRDPDSCERGLSYAWAREDWTRPSVS